MVQFDWFRISRHSTAISTINMITFQINSKTSNFNFHIISFAVGTDDYVFWTFTDFQSCAPIIQRLCVALKVIMWLIFTLRRSRETFKRAPIFYGDLIPISEGKRSIYFLLTIFWQYAVFRTFWSCSFLRVCVVFLKAFVCIVENNALIKKGNFTLH